MVRSKNEKLLSSDVDIKLAEEFFETVPAGFKNKHVFTAAIRLWVSLPSDVRLNLLSESKDKNSNSFVQLVRKIADEQIKKADSK